MHCTFCLETVQGISYNEDQAKLHRCKEEQACLKEIIEIMNRAVEMFCMDIESEDKIIQNMPHTFMSPYIISDKDFTDETNQNLPKVDAAQYSVSRKLLIFNYTLSFHQVNRTNFEHA